MHESCVSSVIKFEYDFLRSALWTKAWRLYDLVFAAFQYCVIGLWSLRDLYYVCIDIGIRSLCLILCVW